MIVTQSKTLTQRIAVFLFALLVAFGLCFALSACSSNDSGSSDQQSGQGGQDSSSTKAGFAQLDIDTSSIDNGSVKTIDVEISDGSTVADVLEKSGVEYSAENGPYGLFVTNIEGIANGSHGEMSGWLFLLNNQFAESAMDKCEVKDGDTITFLFSADGSLPEGLQ